MSELQQDALFLLVCFGGMFSHYLIKYLRKEIAGSLFHYLFVDNPRATGLACCGVLVAAGAAILTNKLQGMSWKELVMAAMGAGYFCDSALNKFTSVG